MAKELKLQVIFGAIDKLTTPFKRINSQISRNKDLLKGSRTHLKKMETAI